MLTLTEGCLFCIFAPAPVFLLIAALIVGGGGQGATNSLRLVSEGCCSLFACCRNAPLPSKAHLFSLFSYLLLRLKYIILLLLLTQKAAAAPSCVRKLNIAFKSQFPWWGYANQPVPVSSRPSTRGSSSRHLDASPFAVVHPLHLKTSFFTPGGATRVFLSPLSIVTAPPAELHVCQRARTYGFGSDFKRNNNDKRNIQSLEAITSLKYHFWSTPFIC